MEIKHFIRDINNFPKEGVIFRDITPLLHCQDAFRYAVDQMALWSKGADLIAGIESRGFIFASAIAYSMSLPLVLLRKPGKLPGDTYTASYQFEYDSSELEVHQDIPRGKALIVDDVLATGGTAGAAIGVLQQAGCQVMGCAFLIELLYLGGRKYLDSTVHSLVRY